METTGLLKHRNCVYKNTFINIAMKSHMYTITITQYSITSCT